MHACSTLCYVFWSPHNVYLRAAYKWGVEWVHRARLNRNWWIMEFNQVGEWAQMCDAGNLNAREGHSWEEKHTSAPNYFWPMPMLARADFFLNCGSKVSSWRHNNTENKATIFSYERFYKRLKKKLLHCILCCYTDKLTLCRLGEKEVIRCSKNKSWKLKAGKGNVI